MVIVSVVLRFLQEFRADAAAAKLKAMINVTATVVRDGQQQEVPLRHLVPGDVVLLAAGDMVPADVRSARRQGPVRQPGQPDRRVVPRGEVRRRAADARRPAAAGASPTSASWAPTSRAARPRPSCVATGRQTYFGGMAKSIVERPAADGFDHGRAAVHLADDRLHVGHGAAGVPDQRADQARNWLEAFFFALAVAVGLTPEMLPMIVTVCLSKGAWRCRKQGHRQAAQVDPELRRHGRAVHRQDRHADDGPRHPGAALRRGARGKRRGAASWRTSTATSRRA